VSASIAQPTPEAERLRQQLKANTKEDTARVRKLLRLSNISTDIDEKERTAREGIAISKKIDDKTGLYNSLLELADAVTLRDDAPQASRLLDMVDSIGKETGNNGLRAQAAFKRTNIRLTPNTDDALKYYLLAVSFAEKENNLLRLGYYQYCTAVLYMTAYNDYRKALEYFLIAEKTAEAGKNKTNLVFVWSGLGDLYTRIGENDKAYNYIRKAYDLHTDTTDIDLTYNLNTSLAKTY